MDSEIASTAADELEARAIRYAIESTVYLHRLSPIEITELVIRAFKAGACAGADLMADSSETKVALARMT